VGLNQAIWQTKERQVADKRQDNPGYCLDYTRNSSGKLRLPPNKSQTDAQAFPKKKALFPNVSRTIPEQMGVFPEQVPKNTRRKVQNFH